MRKVKLNINCKVFLLLMMLTPLVSFAQNEEGKGFFNIKLGAGAVYYYGPYDVSFNEFSGDKLNYEANTSIGFNLNRSRKPTSINAFGSMGFINSNTVSSIFNDQDYTLLGNNANIEQPNINNAYQAEIGLRVVNVLRLSTGYGRQYFEERTFRNDNNGGIDTRNFLDYYSTTVGLQLGNGRLGFFLDANFNYGKDFNNTTLKTVAGLQLQF